MKVVLLRTPYLYLCRTVSENSAFKKKIEELNPDIAQFSIVAPLPGTELWEKYKGTLYLLKNDLENSTTYGINTQSSDLGYKHRDFSDEELQQMLSIAFRRFYLRSSYVIKQLLKMRSMHDLLFLLEGAQSVSQQLMNINFKNKLLKLMKVMGVKANVSLS